MKATSINIVKFRKKSHNSMKNWISLNLCMEKETIKCVEIEIKKSWKGKNINTNINLKYLHLIYLLLKYLTST